MAYTEADIANLEKAISSGVTQVSHNGRVVTYRSLEEMRSILVTMKAEVRGTKGNRRRRRYASFSKGF